MRPAVENTSAGRGGLSRQLHRVDYTTRKVDVRLPGKGNSNSPGARPVHLIITMITWIRTSRLSIKKTLSHNIPWLADACNRVFKRAQVELEVRRQSRYADRARTRQPGIQTPMALVVPLNYPGDEVDSDKLVVKSRTRYLSQMPAKEESKHIPCFAENIPWCSAGEY